MSRLEVLVATMNQSDFSLIEKMNIKSNAIIANQSNKFEITTFEQEKQFISMVTTFGKGVGKNRNLALMYSDAEICLLSDDDVILSDNYNEKIIEAFDSLPQADILIFNINLLNNNDLSRTNTKIKRVNLFNFLNYGAVRIAFRRESIIKRNIWFTTKFGGGSEYGSGEDSLFLRDALRKKLKIYTNPEFIADVEDKESTWFTGYNFKFFSDKGAFLSLAFPRMKYIFSLYLATRYSKISGIKVLDIFKTINKGIKNYEKK